MTKHRYVTQFLHFLMLSIHPTSSSHAPKYPPIQKDATFSFPDYRWQKKGSFNRRKKPKGQFLCGDQQRNQAKKHCKWYHRVCWEIQYICRHGQQQWRHTQGHTEKHTTGQGGWYKEDGKSIRFHFPNPAAQNLTQCHSQFSKHSIKDNIFICLVVGAATQIHTPNRKKGSYRSRGTGVVVSSCNK